MLMLSLSLSKSEIWDELLRRVGERVGMRVGNEDEFAKMRKLIWDELQTRVGEYDDSHLSVVGGSWTNDIPPIVTEREVEETAMRRLASVCPLQPVRKSRYHLPAKTFVPRPALELESAPPICICLCADEVELPHPPLSRSSLAPSAESGRRVVALKAEEVKKVKEIIPRVVLETIPMELLGKKKNWNRAIDLIVTECK
ncbi:hypothetical protein Scep_006540 [Stephania cephalantha]|uniref:Uncharacterized protein n=1 Tax=Stephania cephalantha TaxID=152367 RepID=A0AAP0K9W3_9MAGN